MLTTCPECHTSFRISQAQLDSRRGLVRCGRCSAVFNAYDTLLPELATPPEPSGQAASEPVPAEPAEPPWDEGLPASVGVIPVEPFETEPPGTQVGPAVEGQPAPAQTSEQAQESGPVTPPFAEPASESSQAILLSELPTRTQRPPVAWTTWLWGTASVLLGLVFVLQLVYFLRVQIAATWPDSRPLLAEACRHLGCTLPLPRDPAALRIDASSLEGDPEDKNRAVLHVLLSNRSARTVEWPYLVLALTDVRDAPIALRPFEPREYLPAGSDPARGIAPGQEQEIRLELELKGLSAYGYKLDKQYP